MNFNIDTPEGMESSKRWLEATLALIKNGGDWGVPRSQSIYKINHDTKTATKLTGSAEPEITRVFIAIGWKVREP
jgi:hypothetical protein